MIASVADTYAAITGVRQGKRRGHEIAVSCVRRENHSHGDANPSLRINPDKDTWFCDVCATGGQSIDLAVHAGIASNEEAAKAWMRERGLITDTAHCVERYAYDDAPDDEQFTNGAVDRIEPGRNGEAKSFLQYRRLANGELEKKLNGKKLPLYHRREVVTAAQAGKAIFLVEGERKCDRLRAALREAANDSAVTTIAGGTNGKLLPKMAADLCGASRVIVVCDSDEVGRSTAQKRAQAVADSYPNIEVRVVDLFADRSDGSDVQDWLNELHTVEELLVLVRSARSISRTQNVESSQSARFIRASDLLAESDGDDLTFVLEGLLPTGGTAILAGRPKGGKSTLALNLALRVARGESFLSRQTEKGPVLYLALEGARGGWKSSLRKLAITADDDLYFCIERAPAGAIAWLRKAIEEHRPVLVIVDTAQRLLGVKQSNDYSETSNAFDAVIELARQSGSALLLLHHSGKNRHDQIVDEILGSTAWAATVDTVIVLKRTEHYRSIASDQRFGENLSDTVLTFDPDSLRVDSTGESKEAAEVRLARQAIVGFMDRLASEKPDEMPDTSTILAAIPGRKQHILAALAASTDEGQLERSGSGKKGDPYRYKSRFGSAVPSICQEPQNRIREMTSKPDEIERNSVPGVPASSSTFGTALGTEFEHPVESPQTSNGKARAGLPFADLARADEPSRELHDL